MMLRFELYAVIVAMEEFLAEHKENILVVGYEAYDYVFSNYESLIKLTNKPSTVLLDHEDLKLLGEYL